MEGKIYYHLTDDTIIRIHFALLNYLEISKTTIPDLLKMAPPGDYFGHASMGNAKLLGDGIHFHAPMEKMDNLGPLFHTQWAT